LVYKIEVVPKPFIVFLKNKTSFQFEYKIDISSLLRTDKGYHITFSNGRNYIYGTDKVRYYPLLSSRENIRIYQNGKLDKKFNAVDNYGRYLIFRNGDKYSYPIENNADIEICDIKKNIAKATSIINYFKKILNENDEVSFDIQDDTGSKNSDQISSQMLLRALGQLELSESRSALSNYVDGKIPIISTSQETLIYPFGCNESQKQAVKTALSNSISVIEGPPGTGKTQTILNLIANLIVQKKTIAIVSNNNSAVDNVREKLIKYGYGMIVAPLGSKKNIELFFGSIEKQTINQDFEISEEQLENAKNEVEHLDTILTTCLQYRNRLAVLKTELPDAEIEFSHIKVEQPLDPNIKSVLDTKLYSKWTASKALKLKNFLSIINIENKLSIINKLRFVLQYGLLKLNSIEHYGKELPTYINHKFYELYIEKIKNEILEVENWLAANNEEVNLKRFTDTSKKIFNAELFNKYRNLGEAKFQVDDYRDQFDTFTKHYPVTLSTTLSLHSSIHKDYLFDYLIIDESSQVDIIKSAVCFSCCRNVIAIGDSMQLTHIVDEQSKANAEKFQSEHSISPAYDYVKQNILDSLKNLYKANLKSVMLKEHYRCHPAIIGFCNKKYYKNNLIIMTSGHNHPFKIIETNISGERDNYNQRQIDETDLYIREKYSADYTKVGVITPYRNHAEMLKNQLPKGVEADTIHKFQGREKDVIIFNTVRGKIGAFIDNPNLINVAVSRAVKEFIVVKPASMELPHGTNIGDMIRYIYYITDPKETIIKGSICSVDLLYKEYNKAFISFLSLNKNIKGSAAEIIIHKLLSDDILNNSQFSSIDFVREYKLRDLIRDFQPFSADEIRFIRSNSRIDFLLYNRIDKTPVMCIEVDGMSFHNNLLQQERDNKKTQILKRLELPLLRLSTHGHNEKTKIIESLNAAMG